MVKNKELLEYLHSIGKVPNQVYYQLNKKDANINYRSQKEWIKNWVYYQLNKQDASINYRSQKELMKRKNYIDRDTKTQLENTLQQALEELLKNIKE